MFGGPPIMPMRVWPSSSRWRVADRPPFQLVAPTDGTPGAGSPAGSTTTNGIPRAVSRAICSWRELGDDEDQPGAAAARDRIDPRAPQRARSLLGRQHHAEVVLARDLLDALDDLHRPRALEFVEHDVEQVGVGLRCRALVAVLAEHPLHALARVGRDVRSAVDDFRNCRDRHTRRIGDVRDGHALCHAAKLSDMFRECREIFRVSASRVTRSSGRTARGCCCAAWASAAG